MLPDVGGSLVLVLGGVLVLYVGAELLVAGAGRLALGIGLRATTVGVTVIAIATTTPELFVAVLAALDVSADVGFGTVIGSNIANVGLVLGIAALVKPLSVTETVLRRDVPFMVLAALALPVLGANGRLARFDGFVLLGILGGFTLYLLAADVEDGGSKTRQVHPKPTDDGVSPRDLGLVVVGLVCLVIGSRWLVSGGSDVLLAYGVSELVVGLTVLALGTSLPELAASVVGALRGEAEFAIGNVVGSNIYNVVAVLGIVAIITPIEVSSDVLRFELPVLVGFTLLVVGLMANGRRLSRLDGAILLAGYVGFVWLLLP